MTRRLARIISGRQRKYSVKSPSIQSEDYLTLLKTSQLFGQLNQLDSAKVYIGKALAFESENIVSYRDRDFKASRDSLYRMSIIIYDKIIQLQPTPVNFARRGALKAEIGLYREAISDISKAIESDSVSFYGRYYNRALWYRKLGILDSAVINYIQCIELNPGYAPAFLNKGFALIENKEYDNALIAFSQALALENDIRGKSFTLNNIGYAHFKLKNYELGYQFIQESLLVNPVNSYAYRNLALIDIELADIASACTNIEKSLELGFTDQYGDEVIGLQKEYCTQIDKN